MNRRHALRFENGERRGETIPLEAAAGGVVLTVGRRPGSTIQIADPSVSGRHAELALDARGVSVRDLGSTNGTRVGDERVAGELRLAHGDVLHFGNVRATFLDALVEEPAAPAPRREAETAPAVPAGLGSGPADADAAGAGAGDGVRRVSAEALARAGGRFSAGTWALLLSIVGGGAGAYLWLRSPERGAAGAALREPVPVAGNLLSEGFSFEATAPDGRAFEDRWSPAEGAPASFAADSSARRSGERGLSVALAAGEWAEHRSEALRAPRGGALEVLAWARTESAAAWAGLRFEDSSGSARPFTVWTTAGGGGEFAPLEARVALPPGYDTARAVLRARMGADPEAQGWAEFDDVSLVVAADSGADAAPALRIGEYELSPLGEPTTVVNLFKIDRVLISGLAVERAGTRVELARETRGTGLVLFPTDAGELFFFAEPALVAGGVATVAEPGSGGSGGAAGSGGAGTGGYRGHLVDFEREGVRSILLGTGRDLVRIALAAPAQVTGRPSGAGFHFSVPVAADGGIELQLVFNAERNAAQGLAREAREAGSEGAAVLLWERVQNEYPYDAGLLEEAALTRGQLISAGLGELRGLTRRVERARFFRLVDDYRACRADARALTQRFAGTEVETAVAALAAEIEVELALLEGDLDRHERERLESIARSLEASESPLLAARVQEYLRARFPDPGGVDD